METIADRINTLLDEHNMKRTNLADILGTSRSTVSSICNGRNNPSAQSMLIICQFFNVNLEWLRDGIGEKYKPMTKADRIADVAAELYHDRPDLLRQRLPIIKAVQAMSEEDLKAFYRFVENLKKEQE